METGSENAVTAVYLNYRVFDVIFEALMLLVCVMEIFNISEANKKVSLDKRETHRMKGSEFLFSAFQLSYLFALLLGIYPIRAGHLSPGGGF